jgi:hypothetical protein
MNHRLVERVKNATVRDSALLLLPRVSAFANIVEFALLTPSSPLIDAQSSKLTRTI